MTNSVVGKPVSLLIHGVFGALVLLNMIGCTLPEETPLGQTEKTVSNISSPSAASISVRTISATAYDCYYSCHSDIGEYDSLTKDVPNISEFHRALGEIPLSLQQVMDGKTFYLSNKRGRGYAVLGSWPDRHILSYVERGCILEQPITMSGVLHEFAHILDYHGIRGIYDDPQAHWTHLEPIRSLIFNLSVDPQAYEPNLQELSPGFTSVYAMANDAENFAEHFVAYILDGERFRELAVTDQLLESKYAFFKHHLFDGREYGMASGSDTCPLRSPDNWNVR